MGYGHPAGELASASSTVCDDKKLGCGSPVLAPEGVRPNGGAPCDPQFVLAIGKSDLPYRVIIVAHYHPILIAIIHYHQILVDGGGYSLNKIDTTNLDGLDGQRC